MYNIDREKSIKKLFSIFVCQKGGNMSLKQDRNGVRTPADVTRRYKLGLIGPIEKDLEEKVEKEDGKGLSTNDFTDEDKSKIHSHVNKNILDSITEEEIEKWNNNSYQEQVYNLENYKVADLVITRSSCIKKNNRICINIVGAIPILENIETTLLNLPNELKPTETKDFLICDSSGVTGYGYISNNGTVKVAFPSEINSEIRTSFVYDIN